MAVTVCCPCGHALDCEQLELVLSLECPACHRELDLEIEGGPTESYRAVITVVEGPQWAGEQFILPVVEDLRIGKAQGNWLSLEDDTLADVHCILRLTRQGQILLVDQNSQTGTWIGSNRIIRGKLEREQSFRVGVFRFHFDWQLVDGSTMAASPPPVADDAPEPEPLPTLTQVKHEQTPASWLGKNRFRLSRAFVYAFGGLMGVYHLCCLHCDRAWRWPWSCLVGLAIFAALWAAGRGITLTDRTSRYVVLAVLVVAAVVDMVWAMPAGAVAALVLGASLTLLVMRVPSSALALVGALLGAVSVATMVVAAVLSLSLAAGSVSQSP